MKRKPVIFSLVREQSYFMTIVIAILTFLAVVALGLTIAIAGGAIKWNQQWQNRATIQTTNAPETIDKILAENRTHIKSIQKLSDSEINNLMRPWISDKKTLQKYLPNMWDVEFTSDKSMDAVSKQIGNKARVMPHADALKNPMSTGWKIAIISVVILMIVLCAIGACVIYTAKNIATIHKREIEILNQIGATDSFVARQMQIIIAKITLRACAIGFAGAIPLILIILSVARSARTGLMTMIHIGNIGWVMLFLMPIAIILLSIIITNRTTLKILANEETL